MRIIPLKDRTFKFYFLKENLKVVISHKDCRHTFFVKIQRYQEVRRKSDRDNEKIAYHVAIIFGWIKAMWLDVKDSALGAPYAGRHRRPDGFASLFRK